MKKTVLCTLLFLFAAVQLSAQGIKFFDGSYEDALKLAKKENKAIFVDVYTSWCGPCKKMAKEVFTDKSVGDYFNRSFVCMKLDAEKQKESTFFKSYQAGSYPSYFWLNADGELLHTAGSYMLPEAFVRLAKEAMNSDFLARSKALKKRWDSGERTPALLQEYVYDVVGKTAPDKVSAMVLEFLDSKSEAELKSKDIYPVVVTTASRGIDNTKYSRLALENADIYKTYTPDGKYWEDMYRAIVRRGAISRSEGAEAYNKHIANLNSIKSPYVPMYNELLKLEELILKGNFDQAIPQIIPTVQKYGSEHAYLYKQLFYTLILSKYFTNAPVVKEQIETVRQVAKEAMRVQPCQENLMYIAATYEKEGNIKQAYNCMASLPFFPLPMLSNALYKGLNIDFYGREYR